MHGRGGGVPENGRMRGRRGEGRERVPENGRMREDGGRGEGYVER